MDLKELLFGKKEVVFLNTEEPKERAEETIPEQMEEPEERAEETQTKAGMVTAEDALLTAIFGTEGMTKAKMLEIPIVMSCIEKLAGTVARLPVKLYRRTEDGKTAEVTDDPRVRMLNTDTGDTLNTNEFIKAMIEDYYLGKGAYAYINRDWFGEARSIHHVAEEKVSIIVGVDPIFKDYTIQVNGMTYLPWDFLKIRRRTRDGASSLPIHQERPMIFATAYATMLFEKAQVRKGGNKRGFIEAENRLTEEAKEAIRTAWRNLYSNETENVVILNNGAKFKESSNTSVEMQLYENKELNGAEICGTFGFPISIIKGNATDTDKEIFLDAVTELVNTIETALDNDLLQSWEKETMFFAYDMKELTRGNMKERFEAYEIARRNNFMQIDEIREKEDMEPMGFNMLTLGLDCVLLDPKTGDIYTPNTNARTNMKGMEGKKLLKGGEGNEN
ncbi:MAG: phage portal protein [Anaerotignum sp.]|nr:phage portal protein [Anaerotignum sp.]